MVSISMNPVATDNTRSEYAKKRSAETAYTRHADYVEGNASKRNEVAQHLTRSQTSTGMPEAETEAYKKLGAGQLKQIALPLGETLEETIHSWQNVRREALSASDSSEVDHQLAAAASAKILETEAQLALEDRQRSIQQADATMASPSLASDELQKVFTHAKEVYAFQTEAKQRGYEVEHPGFSQIA